MALTSGTKLGPYEIVSPLGAGGMGEVYRARDTRLDRTVAIKILPEHLSQNPEAKQRFEREARTISSLNHPHICVLHDVGSQDGTSYLVMEYVQGESLEARLQKGPLPLKQIMECGVQISDALEKAHRAGIVHRDLKPANIMLTASGAKLLDFGLAKPAVAILGGSQALSDKGNLTPSTPTINLTALSATPAALTQQGTIVGTFQYMAPEVLQGQEADARSDIFSFGCVLYEMVTGRKAFEGKSQLSVLTAILEKDPEPLAIVQPTTPAALDYAVQTCLEKNPDNRYQTAHDLKLQLAFIAKSGSQVGTPAIAAKGKGKWWWAALALLTLAAIMLAVALWPAPSSHRVVRSNLLPPDGSQFETLYRNGPPAISPDGARVAFVARKDGTNALWVRPLDKLEATRLQGTDDAFFPFWSPDGMALAFFMHGKLWRMDLNGGAPVALSDAPEARGGSWGRENTIVLAATTFGPITEVPAAGGTPKRVTSSTGVSLINVSDRWPVFLPDGKNFLFLHTPSGDADDRNEIRFASVDGGPEKIVLTGKYYSFQYFPGWLLANRGGSVQAWKFDAGSGKVSGDPVQVIDKVASDDITAGSAFSVSSQGTLIYQEGSGTTGDRHVWMDATGKQLSQISDPGIYGGTRLSPDGTRLATPAMGPGGSANLWMWDLSGGTRAELSPANTTDIPVWSADGHTVYFVASNPDAPGEIREVPADGSRPESTLLKTKNNLSTADCTGDGKWLLYEETKPESPAISVLNALPLAQGLETFTVLDSVTSYSNARVKPASNDWLVYQSKESGRAEVYLTRFPRPSAKYQVSQTGATQPVWSRDGKKLFYLDNSQRMTAVEIQTDGDSVHIGPPKTLFQTGVRNSITSEAYDVSRDGRFLVVNSVMESTAPLVLVTNWDMELKK
jgi:Tol biopolymer transport system component